MLLQFCVRVRVCVFVHAHTCMNHDLHSFGLDLIGMITGNEEMTAASHKHSLKLGLGGLCA